jgi:1-pyrroline-5-carboxylate dehydrogenase
MPNAVFVPPHPINEPVRSYAPGSPERARLQQRLRAMKNQGAIEIPAVIGGQRVTTGRTVNVVAPHEHAHVLGVAHMCGAPEVERAIAAARNAAHDWGRMAFEDRAAIFLKAADLLAGSWRDTLNAATMLGQSKNAYQAEIDAACELIDFFRFNVHFARQLYAEQPVSSPGVWNRMEYRPLEGFVLAVTPFNFTAIQGNLPCAPALMGNVVLWKPSTTALFSAHYTMQLLEAAGLPPGVINLLPGDGPDIGGPALAARDFTGLHFTGSTGTFNRLWHEVSGRLGHYRSYPRIVGETGGKDFIVMHESAEALPVAVAIVRGAFEYQGQKCSAASRVYLPRSKRDAVLGHVEEMLSRITVGSVEDFSNFMNAVIDERSFDNIAGYIERAKQAGDARVLFGGGHNKETGYFVDPTVIEADAPDYASMCEEIFGPVVSLYTYDDARWHDTLRRVDETGPYALTGAVFAADRRVIAEASDALRDAAGNFYINDKPTGAVVGQQPFGGARASGTNDKAGSLWNLMRWVSPRAIKETFEPPVDFTYPFLGPDEGAI